MENECVINKQTRGLCGACRLRKCFAFGMNPNLIRSVDNQSIKASTSNGLPRVCFKVFIVIFHFEFHCLLAETLEFIIS